MGLSRFVRSYALFYLKCPDPFRILEPPFAYRVSSNRFFYIRRAFRILPLYWLNVLYNAALKDSSLSIVFINLSFAYGFSTDLSQRIVPGSWSLVVEEFFYLFFAYFCVDEENRMGRICFFRGLRCETRMDRVYERERIK